jgi:hypothetical protein
MRGYATYAKINDSVIPVSGNTRRRFMGIDANMLGIRSSKFDNTNDAAPRLMVNPYDLNTGSYATGFALSLNTPNPSETDYLANAELVIPTIRSKFMATVYIPNSEQDVTLARQLAPIVDAVTTNNERSNLETTFERIATNYWQITVDCANVTSSHMIVVVNDATNTNENLLLEYRWV